MATPIVYVAAEVLSRKQHLDAAKKYLAALRHGTTRAEATLEQLLHHMTIVDISMAELGTTVDELNELVRNGLRMRARLFVQVLRQAGRDEADYKDIIRLTCREAGCTLQDVGITLRELTSFPSRSRRKL